LLGHPVFQNLTVSLVVPSEFAKSQWVNFGFPEEVVTVIPNAIESTAIKKQKPKIDVVKIIYVSNSSRGLEMLLRATNYMKENFKLDIFGSLTTEGVDFFGNRKSVTWVPKLKNLDKITFYGSSEKRTVNKHLLNSDLFVYPSIFLETFCLSVVEAMAVGLPILTTPYGALPEVCGEYPTYFKYNPKWEIAINNDQGTNLEQYKTSFPKYFQQDIEMLAESIDESIRAIKKDSSINQDFALDIQEKYGWAEIKKKWLALDDRIGQVITEYN